MKRAHWPTKEKITKIGDSGSISNQNWVVSLNDSRERSWSWLEEARRAQVGGPTRGPSGPTWGPSGPKPEIWDPKKSKKLKFSKSKSVLPKMSAIFFHAGKRRPRLIWGPPGPFFAWAGKIQKLAKFSTLNKFLLHLCSLLVILSDFCPRVCSPMCRSVIQV